MKAVRFVALALASIVGAGCATQGAGDGLSQIEHIVVIYAENRSFESRCPACARTRAT